MIPVPACEQHVVYVGAVAPEYFELEVVEAGTGFDLSTVVLLGTSMLVTRGNGAVASWAVTLAEQTADKVVLRHVYASNGADVPQEDVLHVQAIMALLGGGVVRSDPVKLHAIRPVVL